MKYLMFLIIIGFVIPDNLFSQTLEIEGKARITIIDLANTIDSVVVVLPDGSLAIRETSSLTTDQSIALSNDSLHLSSGGFVILPLDEVDDADHDPANEIQTWSTFFGKPSGFADDTDNVVDADSDPTNEFQT